MSAIEKQPVSVVIHAPVPKHWINPQQKAIFAAGFQAGFWYASFALEYSVDFEVDDILDYADDLLMTRDCTWTKGFAAGVKDCHENRYD